MIKPLMTPFLLSCIAMISASISPIAWSQAISNQYYEIVEYQGIAVERLGKLDSFMEKALLPSLNRMGIKNVGVLSTEVPLDGKTSLFLVMPLENPNQVPAILKHLSNDSAYLDQGQDYLDTDYKTPVYERMRSELLVAFDCFPKLEVPKQKTAGKDRLFEMRVYESPTERMGVLKVQMFNNGEVPIFLDCGIHPVFFGQALVGDRMPNLTYLTVYDNAAQRDACWKRFQAHPDWAKLKAVEEYQGTVSKIHKFNLLPRSYSQF